MPIRERRADRAALVAALVFFLGALAYQQGASTAILDGDSYFHARAAQQLAEHGIRRGFPQTAFSTWRDAYSDKDFLFHVLSIPFLDADASVPGAKRASIAFAALALAAFGFVLVRARVRFGWIAVLLLATCNPWIWLHLLKLRPHTLGLALLLVEIAFLIDRRSKLLALASAVHVWSHTSFILLPALPIAQAIACRLAGERFDVRPALGILVGVTSASLFHPYFPNNLTIAFDQVFEVARGVAGDRTDIPIELFGAELLPFTPSGLPTLWGAWLPGVVCALGWVATRRDRRPTAECLTLLGIAAALLLACGLATRFVFFFVPVLVIATARAWTELVGDRPLRVLARDAAAITIAATASVAIAFGARGTNPITLRDHIGRMRPPIEDARPAVEFLAGRAKSTDVVFHAFWWSFTPLYYYRPDGVYIEALDPIFLYRFDRKLFAEMLAVLLGQAEDPRRIIAEDFGARFAFVQKRPRERAMIELLRRDPGFEVVFEDRAAIVFEVAPSRPDPGSGRDPQR